ncbi:MAG: hypothetical protein OQK04_11400, partial [Kangiellaceae bacterium]|nr:hypothetical protein [Kangiellaceae bacterium]
IPLTPSQFTGPNRVKRGDSLWKLASQWDLKGTSQNEKMELLFQNNSHAFIDGNRGLLKEGSVISYSTELIGSNHLQNESPSANSNTSAPQAMVTQTSTAQTVILENNIELSTENAATTSGQTGYQQNRIDQMQQKISSLDQTISRQLEENRQLKVQLAQIENLVAKMQQNSTTGATIPLASATRSVSLPVQANIDPKPLGPAIYPDPEPKIQPSVFESLSPNLFLLYWSLGLLAIGLITQRLFNQWKFNRFNKRLDRQLSKLSASTSEVTMSVPGIDELELPKESSITNRIKYIQSAANFYLRCHRFDLAKELVNESLIQYASNSRVVKELLELRRTIYRTIDKGLKTDIVEKLDTHGSDHNVSDDNVEPFDRFGQRWNRKVS